MSGTLRRMPSAPSSHDRCQTVPPIDAFGYLPSHFLGIPHQCWGAAHNAAMGAAAAGLGFAGGGVLTDSLLEADVGAFLAGSAGGAGGGAGTAFLLGGSPKQIAQAGAVGTIGGIGNAGLTEFGAMGGPETAAIGRASGAATNGAFDNAIAMGSGAEGGMSAMPKDDSC
jgi:hypothetical protein